MAARCRMMMFVSSNNAAEAQAITLMTNLPMVWSAVAIACALALTCAIALSSAVFCSSMFLQTCKLQVSNGW